MATSRAYIAVVLSVVVAASVYSFRKHDLFACQASGYKGDTYLAYCGSTGYGDYDHGAFWFSLEPAATRAASAAEVLFIGNSRMQYGLSSRASSDWFKSAGATYYLLGFAYFGNYKFAEPLLRRLQPKARVVVINLDLFFEPQETLPAKTVMHLDGAEARYQRKQVLQHAHMSVCSRFPMFCGNEVAIFRARTTGAWQMTGGRFTSKPVSFNEDVDSGMVQRYVASARQFLPDLPTKPECQILTMAPTVDTQIGTARAIAHALDRPLIAPELNGLQTFDSSHIDPPSAESWSKAFFQEAGPIIQHCLVEGGSSLR